MTTASGPAASSATPTWEQIKSYFRESDRECMLGQGLDLWDCAAVLEAAGPILDQVSSGNMPEGGPPWTKEMVQAFQDWSQSNPTCPPA